MARIFGAALSILVLGACGGGGAAGQGDADALKSDAHIIDTTGEVADADAAVETISLPDADAEPDAGRDADSGGDVADSDGTAGDDGAPGDTSGGGEFGAPCDDGVTCFSGFCVEGPDGPQCTSLCQAVCPSGWACKGVGGGADVTFICVYDHVSYCAPCETKADCDHPLTPGADNRCVASPDGAGSFCATACAGGGCPEGAICEALPDGKSVCRPASGVCACSGYAVRVEASTECSVTNGFGACFGSRSCGDAGLSDCDAAVPAADRCSGLDEDCDGLTDEEFLAGGASALGGAGLGAACDGDDADDCANGKWACSEDGLALVCAGEGATGGVEACNGLDDDCDGETDENFPGLGGKCDGDDSDQCEEGLLTCNAVGDGVICGDLSGDSVEVCDGVDDDCDGETDEDFGVGDGCSGAGACGAGVVECAGKAASRCSTEPGGSADKSQPEICGGTDDDCDGETDEDFGVGAACDGVGACGAGTVECDGPAASRCSTNPGGSENGAVSETCNGVDDDCDGKTDEDYLVGTVCDGVGKCGAGKLECAGLGAAICSTDPGGSQAQAEVELCNAVDDDCDGETDEAFAVGDACEGEGECGAGVVECAGLEGSRCSSDAGGTEAEGAAEQCDGLDNDCDGLSDEDYGVGAACEGVGACGAGVIECAGLLASGCSTDPGRSTDEAAVETCNGVDDDCDGETDEDFGVGGACEGVGACGVGVVECAGAAATRCSTDVGGSAAGDVSELCNGKDDDCDGQTDDGFGLGAACNGGGACGNGVVECATVATTRCSSAPGGSQAGNDSEVCDGVDNDCNGQTDETFGVGQTCDGVGQCGLGTVECAGAAATRCSTDVGGSAAGNVGELCNGLDDDCDGETDNGFGLGEACEGVGACGAGLVECFGPAQVGCSTNPGGSESGAVSELCSGVDEDCDGATDEGFAIGEACVGVGACAGISGVFECESLTAARCSTQPGGTNDQSSPEVCDSVDNDCSGLADDGDAGCPCAVQHVLGVAYMFCTEALSWTDARDACAAAGYTLATIENKAENDGVVAIALPKKASPWWIGLNDRDNEGVHVWVDGSAATYRNWAEGEPNEFPHGEKCGVSNPGEDCVQFSPPSAGAPPDWNDEPCACPYPYVCRQK